MSSFLLVAAALTVASPADSPRIEAPVSMALAEYAAEPAYFDALDDAWQLPLAIGLVWTGADGLVNDGQRRPEEVTARAGFDLLVPTLMVLAGVVWGGIGIWKLVDNLRARGRSARLAYWQDQIAADPLRAAAIRSALLAEADAAKTDRMINTVMAVILVGAAAGLAGYAADQGVHPRAWAGGVVGLSLGSTLLLSTWLVESSAERVLDAWR